MKSYADLLEKIKLKQQELNKKIEKADILTKDEILSISVELDQLILEFHLKNKANL